MNTMRPLTAGLFAAAASYIAASILWIFPGSTVTDGPAFASATGLLTLMLGFILIMRIGRSAPTSVAYRWYAVGLELALVAIAVVAWKALGVYYIGWLATFGALVLVVASLWQLMSDLLETAPPKSDTRAETLYRQRKTKRGTASATAAVAGIVALVILTPVHEWRLDIISPVTVVVSTALLLALLVTRIVASGKRPATPLPGGELSSEPTRSEMARIPDRTI